MGRYDEILARFMAFAEREPRILMGVQVGSGRFRRAERPPGRHLHDAVGAESI